ncbi:predicted protein [Histoplasma capsulatum var. duboisii H88]|uniref:Predicted protein n=1 Tax=Ajellomyces capsulatus (strain H88) TaxID=544711 RepID=F0UPE1_AJEC8|nr:predicted protein [Histoplasma capsulatum var. duboisii H88]
MVLEPCIGGQGGIATVKRFSAVVCGSVSSVVNPAKLREAALQVIRLANVPMRAAWMRDGFEHETCQEHQFRPGEASRSHSHQFLFDYFKNSLARAVSCGQSIRPLKPDSRSSLDFCTNYVVRP